MGGYGSGRRWHLSAKDTTSDHRQLDVRRIKREGLLAAGKGFGWVWDRNTSNEARIWISVQNDHLMLSYKSKNSSADEWRDHNYSVLLDSTKCHLGGMRSWFRCPQPRCGRRVAILYVGSILACRNCLNLAYESQREQECDRLARRAGKIRAKLGWTPGILNGREWSKPPRMHWKTLDALLAEYNRFEQASFRGMLKRMGDVDFSVPIADRR
ncbi:hypothetical protein LCGC14_0003870 [marine sediment metagenome]|uniref:Uncharacterized protein n=1 Tax=marine sediment metagenome TaxID=412755 RepID=A0A0F9YJF0_9ZZZZ|nr:hypothetical protein [Pseudohongiella sp.]HEA62985.1 hypothetical protein [Pseudohongiella sp.]